MNEKIKKLNSKVYTKFTSKLNTTWKKNITKNKIENETALKVIHYSPTTNLWLSTDENEDKQLYHFGFRDKPIAEITENDILLTIDFDKKDQSNKKSLGLIYENSTKINILLNKKLLNEKYPNINLKSFKTMQITSIKMVTDIDTIDLGNIDINFFENLEKLLKEIKNKKTKTNTKTPKCEICNNDLNKFKINSNLNNLKKFNYEYCGECIEKIVAYEFFKKIEPLIKNNETKSLDIVREKIADDKLFNLGLKLLEKYEIISYIGVKKLFFTINNKSKILKTYEKYSHDDNLLLNHINTTQNKQKSKNNNTNDLSKETTMRMNLFINALESGKAHDESLKIAKIDSKEVQKWYELGKKGNNKYKSFYNKYSSFNPKNSYEIKIMNKFIDCVKSGLTIDRAIEMSKSSRDELESWYYLGESNDTQYRQFYLNCRKIFPNGLFNKNSKENNDEILISEFLKLIKNGKTNEEAIEILEIPKSKVKNWYNQGKLGNEKYIDFYNYYMKQYKEENECEICGRSIDKTNKNKICKRCLKKQYASKILIKLLNSIEPEIPFKKDDLKKLNLASMQIQDYIWTLKEFDLINENNNKYSLKNKETLNNFIRESGLEPINITEKTGHELSKTCIICNETQEISKFFKSEKGYENICKNCKKAETTAKYLIELIPHVEFEKEFSENDLKREFKDPFKLKAKLWSLLDYDLVITTQNNTYKLANKNTCLEFLDKYITEDNLESKIEKLIKSNKNQISEIPNAPPVINTEHTTEDTETDEYNKQSNVTARSEFIELIKNGISKEEASDKTSININTFKTWFLKGKNGQEPYDEFYNDYIEAKENAKEEILKRKIIELLQQGESFENALNILYNGHYASIIRNWYYNGQNGDKHHETFYLKCKNLMETNEDYTDTEQSLNQNETFLKSIQEDDDKTNKPNAGILAPLPDKYEESFKSTKSNKTGIAWVNKIGYNWVYSRSVNGKQITIKNNDIYELYNEIIDRNLIWGIRDYSKAKHILNIHDDDNNITVNYLKGIGNELNVIIKGLIENNKLFNILNNMQTFETCINKIITTKNQKDIDLFIELTINKTDINNFEKKIQKLGWTIIS